MRQVNHIVPARARIFENGKNMLAMSRWPSVVCHRRDGDK